MSENRSLHSATASEEDTFRVLRRPSLSEMRNLYDRFFREEFSTMTVGSRKVFFASYGWTVKEFVEKHQALGIPLPHD